MSNRIFSDDNAKAEKAAAFGYLNIIHYLAPIDLAGVGNVCPFASPACAAACLGWHSGHAAIGETNNVRSARVQKTIDFMRDRPAYLKRMWREIERNVFRARRLGLKLCVRLNGSSDIGWENIRVVVGAKVYPNLFAMFPDVQFVDYTKNAKRFSRPLPANYHLTFSRSETNESVALELLSRGVNVAVVFAERPAVWNGYKVIDGDLSDLRHLDERGGVVVGLTPKGRNAKKDSSGFVVR